jgi:hypothetical protein
MMSWMDLMVVESAVAAVAPLPLINGMGEDTSISLKPLTPTLSRRERE